MFARAVTATVVLIAVTAGPASADRVLSSDKKGREGVGVSDNRLIGWAFIRSGTLIAVVTDSKRPVSFRCVAGQAGRRFVMRAVVEDDQFPALFKTRNSGARVSNMKCTAQRS